MTDQFPVAFDSGAEPSTARVGGKCVGLLTMTGRGIRVPPGFAVTTDAFDAALDGGGLRAEIGSVLAGLDLSDTADTERRAAEVRGLVTDRPVPPPVATAVAAAYRVLGAAGDVPVAVRSSAETEDLSTISFAGQYDTYLGVRRADAVVDAVRRCWASLWTARAITYRAARGVPERGLSMAVGVQRMVDARTAGAALTVNPADGDPSKIVIDAAWGLGEPVVSGEMTPDNYVVDKVLLLVRTTLSPQHHELVVAPDGHGLL
ncbi:MAG: PEP/pyruvate-binding domain-containing protein [Streptomyces turgidiscabies]|nr:PEP/pyruvate-binding domain-containing protein [Streptomyces turgidiscabies]